jgi:tRNA dimethylallyltransferase
MAHSKVIAVVGQTATGKSDLAVQIALAINGEVISADSRQIYRDLDIGSGKILPHEMAGIPHHLLDVADPHETYSVFDFQRDALRVISAIQDRNKTPILCGGTGLFVDSVLFETPLPPAGVNNQLRRHLESITTDALFEQLSKRDPRRSHTIDRHNRRRLIRALEIIEATGKPVPAMPAIRTARFDTLFLGLRFDDETLRSRIRQRLLARLDSGMVAEVRDLHDVYHVSWERLDDLGLEYRFVSRYLRNSISYDTMVTSLCTAIWQYSKRQMTWFKRNNNIIWLREPTAAMAYVREFLARS